MAVSVEVLERWQGEILIMNLPVWILNYVLGTTVDEKWESEDIKNYRQQILQHLQICDDHDLEVLINKLAKRHCPQDFSPNLLKRSFRNRLLQCWTINKKEATQAFITKAKVIRQTE